VLPQRGATSYRLIVSTRARPPFLESGPEDLQPGELIGEKVFGRCRTSFTFVQLVEPKCFSDDDRNWCLEEYSEFRRRPAPPDHCFFVVADQELKNVVPSAPLERRTASSKVSSAASVSALPMTSDEGSR